MKLIIINSILDARKVFSPGTKTRMQLLWPPRRANDEKYILTGGSHTKYTARPLHGKNIKKYSSVDSMRWSYKYDLEFSDTFCCCKNWIESNNTSVTDEYFTKTRGFFLFLCVCESGRDEIWLGNAIFVRHNEMPRWGKWVFVWYLLIRT